MKTKLIMAMRCLLDTNIYGLLAENKNLLSKFEKILDEQKLLVYGADVIRKELRDTPKQIRLGKKKLRLFLLELYDSTVENREIRSNKLALTLASEYFKQYKKYGGTKDYRNIKNDFLIVALASLNNMDIIVTEDNKTMASKKADQSYVKVNFSYNLRTPKFLPLKAII